jgi:hypothetical protein
MFRLDSPIMARERQEELYAFLQARGTEWTPMSTVATCVACYPRGWNTTFHNSVARRWLTADIEAINASTDFEKIIISGNRGIKLADRSEYERFLTAEYKEIFRKLRRVRGLARKGGMDQQMGLEGEIREAFMEVIANE